MKKISSIVVLIFIIGSGYGLTESTQTPVSQSCIPESMEIHTRSLEELYPVMTDLIPIQLPEESEEYSVITLLDTPAEFSWTNYDGKDLTTPAKNQ